MKYKRYIVFQYDYYYPTGGINDIHDSYDDIGEARKVASQLANPDLGIVQILDRDTWEVLYDN